MINRPAELTLSPREAALFDRLARGGIVSRDDLWAAMPAPPVSPRKGNRLGKGRAPRVVIHYLKPKLAPYGIEITNVRRVGWKMVQGVVPL